MHVEAPVAQGGEGTCRTGKLPDQHARLQLFQPLGVAVEHGEPDGDLVAEGDRQCLLQVGPAGHRRVAIPLRELGEDVPQGGEVSLDQRQGRRGPEAQTAESMMSWVVAPQCR